MFIIFLILILFSNIKCKNNDYKIDYYIFPSPQFIEMGESKLLIPKDSIIAFNSSSLNNSLLEKIQNVYLEILNKNKKKNSIVTIVEIDFLIEDIYIQPFPIDKEGAKKAESYQITVDKKIKIKINFLNGLVRALETLSQIILPYDEENDHIMNVPLFINDFPIYPIRGIMIDTSSNYISLENIKNIIRGIQHSKMNTLHWHMSGDDYFSVESKIFPEINKYQERTYSQDQVKELLEFAKERGIQIICELEQPAHSRSWKYLENSEEIVMIDPQNPQKGYLNLGINETFDKSISLLNEMIDLFSKKDNKNNSVYYKEIFHLGGNDPIFSDWELSQSIIDLMAKEGLNSSKNLLNYYLNRVRSNIPQDKYYIYWVETEFFRNHEKIDSFSLNNTIFQYYGNYDSLNEIINQFSESKIKLILSPRDYTHLNAGLGIGNWRMPYQNWGTLFYFDPKKFEGTKFDIIGTIVCLWGEFVNDSNILNIIFPRVSIIAEILWNDRSKSQSTLMKFKRLNILIDRLNQLNIKTSPITNLICSSEPEICKDYI